MSTIFYPRLSNIVSVDALPDQLGFIKDGLGNLLADVHYNDLQYSRSSSGDVANYSLQIVTFKSLEVEIAGTGIFLVLNPNHSAVPGSTSSFPISFSYEWRILGWLNQFELSTFSFEPGDFFQLGLTLLGLSKELLVDKALTFFVDAPSPINAFVDEVNSFYETSPAIPYPVSGDPIGEVIQAVEQHPDVGGDDVGVVIFAAFILDNLDLENTQRKMNEFFGSFFNEPLKDYLLRLITPKLQATLGVGVGIKFPRNILVPLTAAGGTPLPEPEQSLLSFDLGEFYFSTEKGIGYDLEVVTTLAPSQIGNTGFEIEITKAKLDVSKKTNIPEATADGRPEDFVGVFIEKCTVKLPSYFNEDGVSSTAAIIGRNLLIGTGGISGRIGIEGLDPLDPNPAVIKGKFGSGFELTLHAVNLDFKQNALEGAEIKGGMKIPGFKDASGEDAEIDISINFDDDGDFSVRASEDQGFDIIKIPDILDVNIKSLGVGRENSKFFVEVSGSIDFADQSPNSGFIGDNLPKDIEIQKLIIWDDGRIEFQGGGLELRKPVMLKLGPVNFSVTALHFGSHEQNNRKYVFFGFDGGLSLKPGGVDARGDGIKFYFTVDNGPLHVFIRIQSIAIDLVIPGDASPENAALLLSGYLAMKEPTTPGGGTEYAGGITFTLPKMKMGGSAAMRYNPDVPAFLIDVGLEIPTPIPLGPTGLGIYGFRGLIGSNYVATRKAAGLDDSAKWYQYYKAKIAPDYKEGIQPSKFEGKSGFSIGAGVSLATSADSGKVFSAKVFFLLSLPEVFLVEGQGAVLKQRIGLDSTIDPPFYAFISVTSQSVETALGANFPIPDSGSNKGDIVQVDALIEIAFFFGNSMGWYVNFGRDLPEEKRIRARILTLFDAYFYLMLSSAGIKTGAGVSYKFDKKFGPLRAKLRAYIDVWGELSFKPIQVGGGMRLGGELSLTLFGIGFSISAEAGLSAEAPNPFVISGYVKACVKVLWTKACAKFSFSWTFDENLNLSELRIIDEDPSRSGQARHIKTGEAFPLIALETSTLPNPSSWYSFIDNHVIPVDSFIDFEFKKGIRPSSTSTPGLDALGGSPQFSNTYYISPKKAKFERVKHNLIIDEVQVKIWNPTANNWENYNVFDAITTYGDTSIFPAASSDLIAGSWQVDHPKQCNKLRMLALSPLNYLRNQVGDNQPNATEMFNVTTETIFCEGERIQKTCIPLFEVGWIDGKTRYFPANRWLSKDSILFRLDGVDGSFVATQKCGVSQALELKPTETLSIRFPDHVSFVELCVSTMAPSITICYFEWRDSGDKDINNLPVYAYSLVSEQTISAIDAENGIIYENNGTPIQKVVIKAAECRTGSEEPCVPIVKPTFGDLFEFLNALAERGHLLKNFDLYPAAHEEYMGIFFDTSLHPKEPADGQAIKYISAYTKSKLTITLDAIFGKPCNIELELLPGSALIDFNSIIGFTNMQPNNSVPGETNRFLIDAIVQTKGGVIHVTLSGVSCFDIFDCEKEGASSASTGVFTPPVTIREPIFVLETFFKPTIDLGLLITSEKIQIASEKYVKGYTEFFEALKINEFEKLKETMFVSELTEKDGSQLVFKLVDGIGNQLTILLSSRMQLPYEKVSGIGNFKVDERRNDKDGATYVNGSVFIGKEMIPVGIKVLKDSLTLATTETSFNPNPQVMPTTSSLVCTEMSVEGELLEGFLVRLLEKGDFTQSNSVLVFEGYEGVFHNTNLYPDEKEVYMNMIRNTKFRFEFELMDQYGYSCYLNIEIQSTEYTLYNVVGFTNIRPVPSNSPGVSYDFIITALVRTRNGIEEIDCVGQSCYPIIECEEEIPPSDCATLVHKVCYLTQEDYEYNDSVTDIAEIQDDMDTIIEGLNTVVQPIWRPNSIFAIQIKTRDEIEQRSTPYERTFLYGFKTGGGIGFYHNFLDRDGNWSNQSEYAQLLSQDKEDTYKLSALNHYLDYANSFPNADGQLINAKPLFYVNPNLRLFFKEQYVKLMYSTWGAYAGNEELTYSLEAMIKDPVDDPLSPSPFIVGADWERHDSWFIDSDVSALNSMMDPDGSGAPVPCITTTEIVSIGINSAFIVPELKPLKAYTAIFNAKFNTTSDPTVHSREVHRYVFQTSRYGNFEDQVMSYELKDDDDNVVKEALFDAQITTNPAMLATAQTMLNGSMANTDPLFLEHADPFDRLFSGIFEMTSLQAPVTTEFNVVKTGNRILGILIRNPEPFNDPKLPTDELEDTVTLSIDGASRSLNRVVYSKDNASAFVTNANHSMNLAVGTYNFEFKFKLYDGTQYNTEETVSNVELTIN